MRQEHPYVNNCKLWRYEQTNRSQKTVSPPVHPLFKDHPSSQLVSSLRCIHLQS